ncbi:MAG: stationary phase survival protein SurE [Pedobacter sp.]|nr:MAG: stationary phase survival protein SurE [Pedobacter sp.]
MANILDKAKNRLWDGLAIGLILPAILAVGAWYIINYVTLLAKADLLYIGCIAVNAYTMQYYFKTNKETTARGVLAATFICAFVFYFYKVSQ